jgi:hypothetical protein
MNVKDAYEDKIRTNRRLAIEAEAIGSERREED